MTFRPDDDLIRAMRAQADAESISVQTLLERAAREYVERRTKAVRLDEALTIITRDYADALRRLGEGPG